MTLYHRAKIQKLYSAGTDVLRGGEGKDEGRIVCVEEKSL